LTSRTTQDKMGTSLHSRQESSRLRPTKSQGLTHSIGSIEQTPYQVRAVEVEAGEESWTGTEGYSKLKRGGITVTTTKRKTVVSDRGEREDSSFRRRKEKEAHAAVRWEDTNSYQEEGKELTTGYAKVEEQRGRTWLHGGEMCKPRKAQPGRRLALCLDRIQHFTAKERREVQGGKENGDRFVIRRIKDPEPLARL